MKRSNTSIYPNDLRALLFWSKTIAFVMRSRTVCFNLAIFNRFGWLIRLLPLKFIGGARRNGWRQWQQRRSNVPRATKSIEHKAKLENKNKTQNINNSATARWKPVWLLQFIYCPSNDIRKSFCLHNESRNTSPLSRIIFAAKNGRNVVCNAKKKCPTNIYFWRKKSQQIKCD